MNTPAARSRAARARARLAAVITAMLLPAAGLAADELLLGAAVISQNKPYAGYRSGEQKTYAPVLHGSYRSLYAEGLFGNEGYIGWNAWDQRSIDVDVIARYNLSGYDAADSDQLAGMLDRDPAVEAGIRAHWNYGDYRVRLEAVTDASDEHEGEEYRLELEWNQSFRAWDTSYRIGGLWQSDEMTGYYFGVLPGEATAERPAYAPGEEISALAAADLIYHFELPVSLVVNLEYRWYGDDIKSSPIVGSRDQWTAGIGLAWRTGGKSRARVRSWR